MVRSVLMLVKYAMPANPQRMLPVSVVPAALVPTQKKASPCVRLVLLAPTVTPLLRNALLVLRASMQIQLVALPAKTVLQENMLQPPIWPNAVSVPQVNPKERQDKLHVMTVLMAVPLVKVQMPVQPVLLVVT